MDFTRVSDGELVGSLKRLVDEERHATAGVVAHLVEVERRRLHLLAAYPSIYIYCRDELGYSDDAAWRRATVAEVARSFPEVLGMLVVVRTTNSRPSSGSAGPS